ncbi:hypothetical protein RJT34_10834 [Clitoria ternatea]|uniref:Zinc finger PHD-type domain-containing protein n=1 Tax=Clitoria ternatea TaxID=43366 RepID=A0AAN9PIZ7_CLITE
MKRNMESSSDDEPDAAVQFLSVSNYYLEDDEDMPVSFTVLPIQWSDSDASDAGGGKVSLRGLADNGLQAVFMQVTAWRFDITNVKPEVSLLLKDGRWVKLQRPRKSFRDTIRTILVTLHFLHRAKRNRELSVASVWKDLCSNRELSSYGFKPSQNDLLDHVPLISEAAKRDRVLAKSKPLLTMLEKLENKKLSDKGVKDLTQPGLTIDSVDNDITDDTDKASEADDDVSVCALCDNGGDLVCCDGPCKRSFHGTKEAGKEASCDSLGLTKKEVEENKNFYCKNCEYHQHQCFACGKLGSSDKVKGAEVTKCSSATCDHFYHPHCVAKLLPQVVKHFPEELERNIADGDPFTCPVHYCCVCKELEDKMDPELRFAVCMRCPKSYHRKCLPREIVVDDNEDVTRDVIQRGWIDLLPNNRILIYCLNHEIDDELGTPIRDHIKFPSVKATVEKFNTINRQKKTATKERSILKKKNVDSDYSSGKSTAKGLNLSGKVGSKLSNKMISGSSIAKESQLNEAPRRCSDEKKRSFSNKIEMPDCEENHKLPPSSEKVHAFKSKGLEKIRHIRKVTTTASPPLDADSEKRVLAMFEEAKSSVMLENVLEKYTFTSNTHSLGNAVENTITMGRLEGSVDAVRTALRKLESGCSIQDVEDVCDPGVLKQIYKWKIVEKIHWYVQNGDTIVDLCSDANDFSILMKKKLEEAGMKCSYRNYDLLTTKEDFSYERRDWMTVQPTELPAGSQLIMRLNPPFGPKAALANKFLDKALEFKPKLLIIIVPPETERLDKKLSPYDLIWEDRNFLSGMSFYLPGSVDVEDRQIDQKNVRPPILSLWSHPDWTTEHKVIAQEHGHTHNQHEVSKNLDTDMLAAHHTTDGNDVDNLIPSHDMLSSNDQEDQAYTSEDLKSSSHHGQKRSLYGGKADQEEPEHRKDKSGKTSCKRKRIEEENNRRRVGAVSPAKRQAVNEESVKRQAVSKETEEVPDHSQPSKVFQPESAIAPAHVEDGDNVYQHLEPIQDCGKTYSGIRKGQRIRSLGSEPLKLSENSTFERSVPQPIYGGELLGFAAGPNLAYANQHSAGWLDE